MNKDLQNLETKVENEGTTPQGRVTASEWNILVDAVKALDIAGEGQVDSVAWANVTDKPSWIGSEKPSYSHDEISNTPDLAEYATIASLTAVTKRLDEFLAGSDTDTIINKWKELETFLSGLTESDDLATLLSGKADKATTLAGYGITDAYTKAHIDNTFVKLATAQPISARHDFTDGLEIGGLPIYKSQDDVIYIDANVVVRGGITARGTNGTTAPSIWDGLPIDGTTIYWDNGVLKSSATSSGGIDEAFLEDYLLYNKYATQDWVTGRGYITGITSSMVTNALGYTPLNKTGDVLTLKANQYTGAYALDMQNSNIVNLNALFTSDVANNPTEGIQFKRTNGNFDSLWAADGIMYFSPNGNNAEMTGEYATSYAVLHAGNYGSYPVRNPNALSWSGYSSGSYDGSTAQSIALPTKLSQLTDDVVRGKYLPIAGGTVNGNVRINKFLAVGAATSAINPARAQINLVSSGANPCDLYLGADDTLYWNITARDAAATGGLNKAFALYDVTNSAYRMIMFPSGNLTIGGTTASEKLHVHGNMLIDGGEIMINAAASSKDSFLKFSDSQTNDVFYLGIRRPTSYYGLTFYDGDYHLIALVDSNQLSPSSGSLTIKGNLLTTGALSLGLNNRTHIIENPFAASGMTLADGNKNPLVTVSYYSDHAYIYNYKNSKKNSGIAFYDNGTVVASQNFMCTGGITARYTSDMRLKQNRRGFKASEVLMSLGAVQQFEYIPSEVAKNKIYEGTHIGLIYQNVVGTALNRMCYEREDGYGSLNYLEPSFISLLAGVAQEHEVRLNAHDLRMNQQDEEMRKLHLENKRLKKKIKQLENRGSRECNSYIN